MKKPILSIMIILCMFFSFLPTSYAKQSNELPSLNSTQDNIQRKKYLPADTWVMKEKRQNSNYLANDNSNLTNFVISTGIVNITSNIMLNAKWAANSAVKLTTPSITTKATDYKTIQISWKTVKNATNYEVWRSTSISRNYTKIADVKGGLSFTDTGLPENIKYYYKVRAYWMPFSTIVYSSYSSVKYAKPVWPAIKLTGAAATYNSIALRWNNIAGVTGYEVYHCDTAKGTYTLLKDNVTANSYTDKGLTVGKTYYYKVRAYDDTSGDKVYGPYSGYTSAKPAPSLPANLAFTKSSSTGITLSWNAVNGATGYEIYRATLLKGSYTRVATTSDLSYENTALIAEETYYYKIRAYCLVGSTKIYGGYTGIKIMILSYSSGSSTETVEMGSFVNCKNYVTVRSGASASNSKLGTAAKGNKYAILGTSGNWYKILYNGMIGYINNACLKQESENAGQTGDIIIKAATFNAACLGFGAKAKAAAALIKASGADIVSLQEIDKNISRSGMVDWPEELASLAGYPYYFFAPVINFEDGLYGTLILSRYPIIEASVIPLQTMEGTEGRALACAKILTEKGAFYIFNTHLSYENDEAIIKGLPSFVDKISSADCRKYFVTGDFNTTPDILSEYLSGLTIANTEFPTYFKNGIPEIIDNILYTQGITVTDLTVKDTITDGISDHNFLLATVNIQMTAK